MLKFAPPAGITDFDANPALYDTWDTAMSGLFDQLKTSNDQYKNYPAFYSPKSPPRGTASTASPTWPGLPKGLSARFGNDKAAELADKVITWGTNPDDEGFSSTPFKDAQGNLFPNNGYRQQDEYLEWVVKRDASGGIVEIDFTCEGPEYWGVIASDRDLLLKLYRQYVSNDVQIDDLFFPQTVTFVDPNDPNQTVETFTTTDYNPYNRWNIAGAMHLTHPANTLGAEVTLGAQASALFKMRGAAVTANPNLTCCQGIGEINRGSDPNIAATVNGAVLQGNYVTLRNPVGLYMLSFDATAFTMPDRSPIANFIGTYMTKVRASADGTMTLRAVLRVPDGVQYQGRQMIVGDLLCNRKQIQFGGQVAATITMGLFAESIPGTPHQTPIECTAQGCPSPSNASVIVLARPGTDCSKLKAPMQAEFSVATESLPLRKPTTKSGKRLRSRVSHARG